MSRFRRKNFDPVAYWARKPICAICKERKVKYGNICGECQAAGQWSGKTISPDKIESLSSDKLVKQFNTTPIERVSANPLVKSIIGYLKDCAVAILRGSPLIDVRNTKDVSYLQAPGNSLELLNNGGFSLEDKEAFDLLYKIASRPNEFDLILGTLFLCGSKKKGDKDLKIYAPLLYVKIDATRSEDSKVVNFSLKEDTVFLNQSLITSLVDIKDEGELEVRFHDFYESQPSWPLNLESLNQFLQNLSSSFPGIFKEEVPEVDRFANLEEVESVKDEVALVPTNALIIIPKQEAEGTVVDELNLMLQNLLNKTGVDCLFIQNTLESQDVGGGEAIDQAGIYKQQEEQGNENWHNLWPVDLSETQKKVIFSARKNMLTVVSGPPGTGKSYTIAAIILDHLLAGKRVLFASRMDKAVEVVASWLESFAGPFAVARSGGRNAQRELAEKLELLTGANSPAKAVSKKELQELEEQYVKVQEKITDLESKFLEVVSQEREWARVQDFLNDVSVRIKSEFNFSQLNVEAARAAKLKEKAKGADVLVRNKNFFVLTWWGQSTLKRIRHILGVDEKTSTEDMVAILDKVIGDEQKKEIETELSKFEEVNRVWAEIQNLQIKLRETAREILTKTLLGNLHLIVNNHQKRIEIRDFVQSLKAANLRKKLTLRQKVSTETLLSAFPCWASTTSHLSQILPLEAGMFDLVIFDEASQCDLASATPAMYRANRVVIVGDPKQLNHVVFLGRQAEYAAFANNEVPLEMQDAYRFTQRSLFDVAEDKVQQQNYLMLDEHFRSDPQIISFSNEKFYEGKLRIMTQRPIVNENGLAIKVDYVHGRRTEGTTNPKEIEAIFKHVEEIITASSKEKPTTIGILCPFRDQVDAISKELPKFLTLDQVSKHKVVIGTAHSLQGDEKDVVILSLSISPGFHHGTLHFLEKPNVFNVAITRAKKRLIVVSSVEISDLPNGLLKDFLLHAEAALSKTIPLDKFDSKFEQEVANALAAQGLNVWPQYESAGFFIDLVAGDGNNYIAIECDGPSHFDLKERQNYYDVWRQKILERAGWRFVRISSREWERDKSKSLEKVYTALAQLK